MDNLIATFATVFLGTPGNTVRILANPLSGGEFPILVATPLGEFGGASLEDAMTKAVNAASVPEDDDNADDDDEG